MPARKDTIEGLAIMLEHWSVELRGAKNADVAGLSVELHIVAARLRTTVEGWPDHLGNVVGRDSEPPQRKL